MQHPFLVVTNVQKDLLLGSDFLLRHGAKIDLDAMTMTLRDAGPTVDLYLARGDMLAPRVPVVEVRPTVATVASDRRLYPEIDPLIPLNNRYEVLRTHPTTTLHLQERRDSAREMKRTPQAQVQRARGPQRRWTHPIGVCETQSYNKREKIANTSILKLLKC